MARNKHLILSSPSSLGALHHFLLDPLVIHLHQSKYDRRAHWFCCPDLSPPFCVGQNGPAATQTEISPTV